MTVIVPGAGPAPPVPPVLELEVEPPEEPEEVPEVQVVVTEDVLGSLSQVWDVLFELMLGRLGRERPVQ